ncbi:14040_t:CDS:2, partial [Gigaspora rosea]
SEAGHYQPQQSTNYPTYNQQQFTNYPTGHKQQFANYPTGHPQQQFVNYSTGHPHQFTNYPTNHKQKDTNYPTNPPPAHINQTSAPPSPEKSAEELEKEKKEQKELKRKEKKAFPYRFPSVCSRRLCIILTVCNLLSLLSTGAVFRLYYTATFTNRELSRKLFIIILGCELLPRFIQAYLIYRFTKEKLGFDLNDTIGILLCQINYYYWMGKGRADLKRSQIHIIEFTIDAIGLVKLVVLLYILGLQSQKTQSDMNKKVVNDMSNTILTLTAVLAITYALLLIRFFVFLVKKIGRCMCGDSFCRS